MFSKRLNAVVLTMVTLAVAACGGATKQAEPDPVLAEIGGDWLLVEGSDVIPVTIDAGERKVSMMKDGQILRRDVTAELGAEDDTYLLTMAGETIEDRILWLVGLVGERGYVTIVEGVGRTPQGFSMNGPQIFRDQAAAEQLAEKNLDREMGARMFGIF